jgi:recombination protein RecA
LDLGVKAGIIEKSGTWFSYGDTRIGQGRENAKSFLTENPEIAATVEKAIRANAGLVSDAMLADPAEGDGEEAEGEDGEAPKAAGGEG